MLKRMLAANVLMAFFYSTILFVIVYASAWQGLSGNYQNRPRQYESFNIVTEVISAVQNFQKAHGRLPANLTDKEVSAKLWLVQGRLDPKAGPLDAWGHPLHYEVKGDKFTVVSYGRDGRPGGVGIDADLGGPGARGAFILTNAPNVGPLPPPTFEQFLTTRDNEEIAGSSVVMWATLCGICAFGLMFATSSQLWWLAFRNLSRAVVGRLLTLSPRTEESKHAESELISLYTKSFPVIDP
ncbi:MAG TPA: type II secretion system protein GspG, partial [Planctomycetaceae bacterium]|nr:type II secretion system protein GspG [Planctomycetaceae bacterium]